MKYVKVAKIADFSDVSIRSFSILAKKIAVVKQDDGTYFATEIACKHQNADLTHGKFDGDIVTCPRHGWVYDLRTGRCLNQPSAPLRRHGLTIKGKTIWVSTTPLPPEEPDEDTDWAPELHIRTRADAHDGASSGEST